MDFATAVPPCSRSQQRRNHGRIVRARAAGPRACGRGNVVPRRPSVAGVWDDATPPLQTDFSALGASATGGALFRSALLRASALRLRMFKSSTMSANIIDT